VNFEVEEEPLCFELSYWAKTASKTLFVAIVYIFIKGLRRKYNYKK